MRIPNGVTDQVVYFVAVDSTDLKTRETGLTTFTVYRDRNGGGAAAMTTPTVTEVDATNLPGVYKLLLDEDMTIAAGNDSEEMVFHITQASMAPVTRTIEIYRRSVTAGNTLGVASDGDVSGNVDGTVATVNTLTNLPSMPANWLTAAGIAAGALDGKGNWNIGKTGYALTQAFPTNFSDLAIAITTGKVTVGTNDDKTGYTITGHTPQTGDSYAIVSDGVFGNSALNDSLGNLSSGVASGGSVNATGVVVTTGTETLTYTATHEQDDIVHEVDAVGGNIDFYYTVTLGGSQSVNSVTWRGYVQSNGDSVSVQYYDWIAADWKTELVVSGSNGTTFAEETIPAISAYTGTGANLGEVRIRGLSTTATKVASDRLRFNYTASFDSVGYSGGQVWINTVSGTAGTELYRNGTADNQSLTLADAVTIAAGLPLDKFVASNSSSITFASSHADEVWSGDGWTLALGGQDVSNTHIKHCNDVSGIGTTPTGHVHIIYSHMGALTLGECHITGGSFTSTFDAGAAGNYHFEGAKSGVAGAGAPTMTFSGLGSASTMNIRAWEGGGTWVFDSNCTASIEVTVGGTHDITTGGGNVEFRGTPKNLVITTSGAGTTNVMVWSGCPISISGTGGTVNIYGMHNGITDTSSGTTVTDLGANIIDIPSILSDTNDIQTRIPAALVSGRMDSNMSAINDVAASASNLERSASVIIQGAAIAGTLSTTQMTTDLTEATDDHYNGRIIIWTSGALIGQATNITDYIGASKLLTFTALTEAPTATDTFVIL